MTFNDLQFKPHPVGTGRRATVQFANGYGVSVVQFMIHGLPGSYGSADGKWELGVLWNDKLCYDTPITNGVLGWLSEDDVTEALQKIEALPSKA